MSDPDASDSSMVEQLKKLLIDYGTELLEPCDSTEELLRKLDKLERVLSNTLQDDKKLVEVALQPSKEALIANRLIRHAELDVRVSVASCISEILRITTPDEPYEEDEMKEFFQLANSAFGSLSSMSGRAYSKAVSILQTISYSQSFVIMLDLKLYAIVHQMFHLFLDGIRTSHSHDIFSSMENIMTVIIHNNVDYNEFSVALAKILLDRLRKENQDVSPVAFRLAENIFRNCSGDLKTYLSEAVKGLGIPVKDYAEVVVSLFQDAAPGENVDSEDTARDVPCPGEAGSCDLMEGNKTVKDTARDVPCHGEAGLCDLMEGNETVNFQNDDNCHENQSTTSYCCDEPPNLCSPKHMQREQKRDEPILRKRSRKPNSLIKAEEGYDPFWMFIDWTSLINPHCEKKMKKKARRKISKDSLSSKPTGQPPGVSISPKAKKIQKESKRRQGSLKVKGKTVASEDLSRDIIVEDSKVRVTSRSFDEEVIGCKIKVWWPLDEMFYEGKITGFDLIHRKHCVEYDDGDIEVLDLTKECWQLIGDDNLSSREEIVATPGAYTEMLNDCGRKSSHLPKRKKASKVRAASKSFKEEVIGRRIKVWWRRDKMFHKGKIAAFDNVYELHQVEYDNGVIEFLDLTRERFQLLSGDNLSIHFK